MRRGSDEGEVFADSYLNASGAGGREKAMEDISDGHQLTADKIVDYIAAGRGTYGPATTVRVPTWASEPTSSASSRPSSYSHLPPPHPNSPLHDESLSTPSRFETARQCAPCVADYLFFKLHVHLGRPSCSFSPTSILRPSLDLFPSS